MANLNAILKNKMGLSAEQAKKSKVLASLSGSYRQNMKSIHYSQLVPSTNQFYTEKELEDLKIAGCWVHCRRKFDEALKAVPKAAQKESLSYLVIKQIQAVYREEDKLKDLKPKDRLRQRQVVIKPLVDALFAYLKSNERKVSTAKLKQAVTYALNQEKYLRVFLEDGEVPMDNNASERAIRGFCIGKKNWEMIDTINGATSSAIIYSIAETAKANNLKPYEYFEYLLTQIPAHMDDTDRSFLEDLLPWSPKLPEYIRKQKDRG